MILVHEMKRKASYIMNLQVPQVLVKTIINRFFTYAGEWSYP